MELDSLGVLSIQMTIDRVHCIYVLADDHIMYIYAAVVVGLVWLVMVSYGYGYGYGNGCGYG